MVFAPTRSGQGAGLILPTLLAWEGSSIVLDIKGENWALTAGWRKSQDQVVWRFDPSDPSGTSARFNPLEEIRIDITYDPRPAAWYAAMPILAAPSEKKRFPVNSISLCSLARRALFTVIWLALAFTLAFAAGLCFNPTPSLPKGIYHIVSDAPAPKDFVRGELVSFCLEGEFADLALERGYLEHGSCPSSLRPLLKRLAGLPGDFVNPSAFPIRSVDSHGRSILPALVPGVVPPGMAMVLSDHPGSFDSRYFGNDHGYSILPGSKATPVVYFQFSEEKGQAG